MQPLRQQIDHDNFPMGLMASCRMRTSVSTMSSLGSLLDTQYPGTVSPYAPTARLHMDNLDNTTTTRSKQAREGSPDGQQTVRKFGTVLSTSY